MAKSNAESFEDVLELARTRRHTGMVAIEHKQSGGVEEGEVFLQAGQPIYARVGRLLGQDALNWLLKWHNVNFTMGTDETMQSVATTAGTTGNSTTSNPSSSPRYGSNSSGTVDRRASSLDNTYTPGIEWLVPQKRGIEREVLALPLTRRQRFIYFLVDGRRTVSDLSRCTGKNIQEIELILSELRAQGLVAV